MKKLFWIFLMFLLISNSKAQTGQLVFQPHWKVGDEKTMIITTVTSKNDAGEITEEAGEPIEAFIKVIKEKEDHFVLSILYENVVFNTAEKYFDKFGEELKPLKQVEFLYKVSKTGTETELINWKEIQAHLNKTFEQVKEMLESKMPDDALKMDFFVKPLLNTFDSKEKIEAYFSEEIGYLTFPFGKSFTFGDTLKITETVPNPFSKKQEDKVEATSYSTITAYDDKNKTINIVTNGELDMSEFIKMMKSMMEEMGKMFGQDQESINEKSKEFETIDFEMKIEEVIHFDFATGWPIKVEQEMATRIKDPKNETTATSTKTITFK